MPPAVRYATKLPTNPADVTAAKALQQWLSNFSGVFLAVDGIAGKKTSDAFKCQAAMSHGAWPGVGKAVFSW